MSDSEKPKEELQKKLETARKRIAELEKSETKRKQVEKVLHESEERIGDLMDSVPNKKGLVYSLELQFKRKDGSVF